MLQPLIAACIALLLLVLGWTIDHARLKSARDNARAERDALIAQASLQRAQFEAIARQREREQRAAVEAIRNNYTMEMQRADEKHAAVVAGLRADAVRLRQHWQGCTAAAELSRAAEAAARVDESARLREQGAADIVRAAAECDAQVRALQDFAREVSHGPSQR